jgi:hypothetical protein
LNVKLSKISSTRQSSIRLSQAIRTSIIALNMVQLTTEQRTFVIKTFYETSTLQQGRVAFGLTNFALEPHISRMKSENRKILKNLLTNFLSSTQMSKKFL